MIFQNKYVLFHPDVTDEEILQIKRKAPKREGDEHEVKRIRVTPASSSTTSYENSSSSASSSYSSPPTSFQKHHHQHQHHQHQHQLAIIPQHQGPSSDELLVVTQATKEVGQSVYALRKGMIDLLCFTGIGERLARDTNKKVDEQGKQIMELNEELKKLREESAETLRLLRTITTRDG